MRFRIGSNWITFVGTGVSLHADAHKQVPLLIYYIADYFNFRLRSCTLQKLYKVTTLA